MSHSSPKLLILSASTGNGHVSAAQALEAEAKSQGLVALHVDCMDRTSRGFTTWYRGGYETLVRQRPQMWGHLYRSSDRPLFNFGFQTSLDWWFCRTLEPLLAELRPDWVVCTHSLPQPRLAVLRKKYGFKVGIVVTDLYPHRMWMRGRPDHFFVPQEWSKQVLTKRYPRANRHVDVTGIPINPVFLLPRSKLGLRVALRMSGVTALVASGGIGGGPVLEVLPVLLEAGINLHVIAGRNDALLQELRSQYSADDRVVLHGQVTQPEMADLMSSCDFVVSKPGGLTTFEALAVGLPFLVYWPFLIPGQEEGNAEYLEEVGAGRIARDLTQLSGIVNEFVETRDVLPEMSRRALQQAKPQATQQIIRRLREL